MKICISGAGIAGPALAYWLLRYGHTPTLVESAAAFRGGGYIIDFWGAGFEVAARMGLTRRLRETGYQVGRVRMVDAAGRPAGGFNTKVFTDVVDGGFVSLPRGDLAAIIFDTVKDDVETLFSHSISSLRTVGEVVEVGFEGGAMREFDLVIGADGLHSNVRKLGFGPESFEERYLGYHVACFEAAGYLPREELAYVAFASPGKQIARFALRNDRTDFMLIFTADEPLSLHGREEERAFLHRTFGHLGWECDAILGALDGADNLYFDRVSQIRMPRWSSGRIALLGDAAFCPSLLAGQGCALAMIAAYVMAGEIARTPREPAAAFKRYEHLLHGFMDAKQRAAEKSAGTFAPRTQLGITFRRWATAALRVPVIAKLALAGSLRDALVLPEYLAADGRPTTTRAAA